MRPIALTRRFTFMGDSMSPLLQEGDELWVRPVAGGEARPGDVLVCARFDRGAPSLVAHRLVSWEGGQVVTRGDRRPAPDAPVPEGQVLGRVVGFTRRGRFAAL